MTFLTIPKIIGVVEHKRLMDVPNTRSSHTKKTPTLGGLSFFYCLIFALFFLRHWDTNYEAMYFIPGLTILLIIGLKDDLLVLSPYTKLIAQCFAIGFLLANEQLVIHSLHGFLGVDHIPQYVYYGISGFLMLTITNAYNLIDGIDGLAAMVGIIILMMYTAIFYLIGDYFYMLFCLSLNGSLIAFLSFNLSDSKKIFMGDTGSLIVGFVISILTIKFLSLSTDEFNHLPFLLENAPLIAISILIVPLFDTTRVFAIRIANKKSPFSPDRNHIHHILIDYLSLSHTKASLLIGCFNLTFVIIFVALSSSSSNYLVLSILVASSIGLAYLFFRLDYSFSNIKRRILIGKGIQSLKSRLKAPKKMKS